MSAIAMHIRFHIGLVAANARGSMSYRTTGKLITGIAMSANPAIIWTAQFARL